ncbi:MAG: cobalamin-dependent protein [Gammaproteobacteria bacterium]|nr:cobalamin-dependent protein [Gammaproteobacteria bacterium]
MTHADPIAAEQLESQAGSIAASAAAAALARDPGLRQRFGAMAIQVWTDHMRQQLVELAVAVGVGRPAFFAEQISWLRMTMTAREVPVADLRTALDGLRDAVVEHLPPDQTDVVLACIDQAQRKIADDVDELPETTLDPGFARDRLAMRYMQAVVTGNALVGMEMVLDAVHEGMSLRDAMLQVLLPAQREAGHLWHLNRISIAEEHMVTSTTQRLLAVLASRAEHTPDRGRTVVAATVSGNAHDIGIRAIAYLLEIEGWRTIYLGADLPRREFPAAIVGFDADLVMLSLALTNQLPALRRTIESIRARSGDSVKILIGGTGLENAPDMWRELGADGYAADAETALSLAAELVPLP